MSASSAPMRYAVPPLWAVAMVATLLFATLVTPFINTPTGIQCPTAAIQTMRERVITRTPCGCLVSTTVERKLRPGEPGFKQCRCTEKKAAQTTDFSVQAPLVLAITTPIRTVLGNRIAEIQRIQGDTRPPVVIPAQAPPTPPPDLI